MLRQICATVEALSLHINRPVMINRGLRDVFALIVET